MSANSHKRTFDGQQTHTQTAASKDGRSKAQREPGVELDRMADDVGREAVTLE
jgi:hypothetical protein